MCVWNMEIFRSRFGESLCVSHRISFMQAEEAKSYSCPNSERARNTSLKDTRGLLTKHTMFVNVQMDN